MSGSRTTPFDRPGTVVWLLNSFNALSPNERWKRGLNWPAGGHPFLIVKTYGVEAKCVLGCVCSKNYRPQNRAVPFINHRKSNDRLIPVRQCDRCRTFPGDSRIPNVRYLNFHRRASMTAHSHVQFVAFVAVEKDHLGTWWSSQLQDDLVLDSTSLDWVYVQFAGEIALAEKRAFLFRFVDLERPLYSPVGSSRRRDDVRSCVLVDPNVYGLTDPLVAQQSRPIHFAPLLLEAGRRPLGTSQDIELGPDITETPTEAGNDTGRINSIAACVWNAFQNLMRSLWVWRWAR